MVPHFEVAELHIGKFIISAAKFGVQPRSTTKKSKTTASDKRNINPCEGPKGPNPGLDGERYRIVKIAIPN
jgi:hypothetical protein